MFAFADETGNSGRNIFDQNEYFRLGAILATSDIAPAVKNVLDPYLKENCVERFHAHEWPEEKVSEIGQEIFDALDQSGSWVFSLTEIHKPYMAPTKFVDVIFDAGENKAVPGEWYWDELNRHVLCLTNDAMSEDTAKLFWTSYLGDDFGGIAKCLDLLDGALEKMDFPLTVRRVISGAFEFARQQPAEFTLGNTQKKKGYQASSPNVVASPDYSKRSTILLSGRQALRSGSFMTSRTSSERRLLRPMNNSATSSGTTRLKVHFPRPRLPNTISRSSKCRPRKTMRGFRRLTCCFGRRSANPNPGCLLHLKIN
ncbi:hypothetical protein NKH71_32665 [Mesorhizobium sp. M0983]|uniref:hypothetical protein n=1 Tax=Mesorhizobium sp. M0983 TaxID=2957040 RepID=UPI0033352F6C